ncbi:MAG: HlyD family efflux transporter periplasmic adaptor subunit [Lachnotalea sp.]
MASRNKKVAKYRKPLNINIGMIVFGIIFIYVLFYIIMYIMNPHISVYEVNKGSLATNNTYQGFIIRTETKVTADQAGYVNFYAREGEKIGDGQTVYTLDETGKLAEMLSDATNSESTLSEDDINTLKVEISSFSNDFNTNSYSDVYNFKSDIQNKVLELVNVNLINSLANLDSADAGAFTTCSAPAEGLVIYSTDGYEEVTADTLTEDILNYANYQKNSIKTSDLVNQGDFVYKLITDEAWSIIVPLDEQKAADYADKTTMKIKFKKDGVTANTKFSIIIINNKPYAKLDLTNSCIRYATDRFIDVEFMVSNVEGLKIPTSSVIEKEFYTIPVEYATQGTNGSDIGFILESYDENGTAVQKVVEPTIYFSNDEDYYVETHEFEVGNYIIKTDSNDRYPIGKTAKLTGVYNINKGYAVFKQINELYQNEEYYIVEEGTTYGIAVYDHIVLNGKAVKEDDIIY